MLSKVFLVAVVLKSAGAAQTPSNFNYPEVLLALPVGNYEVEQSEPEFWKRGLTSMITAWQVPINDFSLHVWPMDACQVVQICPGPMAALSNGTASLTMDVSKFDCTGATSIEYYVYERRLRIGKNVAYFNQPTLKFSFTQKGRVIDTTHPVALFKFKAYTEYDGDAFKESHLKEFDLDYNGKLLLVIANAQHCHPRMTSVSSVKYWSPKLSAGPYTYASSNGRYTDFFEPMSSKIQPKTYEMFPETTKFVSGDSGDAANATKNDTEGCPRYFKVPLAPSPGFWQTRKTTSVLLYKLRPLKANDVAHLTLKVGDSCQWLRICFGDGTANECSVGAKRYNLLDLLIEPAVLIPTDTDVGKPLALDSGSLRNGLLLFKGKTLTFAYGSSYKVFDEFFETMPTLVDSSAIKRIYLFRAPKCEAALAMHSQYKNTMPGLIIDECDHYVL